MFIHDFADGFVSPDPQDRLRTPSQICMDVLRSLTSRTAGSGGGPEALSARVDASSDVCMPRLQMGRGRPSDIQQAK